MVVVRGGAHSLARIYCRKLTRVICSPSRLLGPKRKGESVGRGEGSKRRNVVTKPRMIPAAIRCRRGREALVVATVGWRRWGSIGSYRVSGLSLAGGLVGCPKCHLFGIQKAACFKDKATSSRLSYEQVSRGHIFALARGAPLHDPHQEDGRRLVVIFLRLVLPGFSSFLQFVTGRNECACVGICPPSFCRLFPDASLCFPAHMLLSARGDTSPINHVDKRSPGAIHECKFELPLTYGPDFLFFRVSLVASLSVASLLAFFPFPSTQRKLTEP